MRLILITLILLTTTAVFGQVKVIDRSDTSIKYVNDFWYYDHWVSYPATSAIYVPPCQYRIVQAETPLDTPPDYNHFNSDQFQILKQRGKYEIVNSGDTILIPLQYDSLIRITNASPKVFIAKDNGKFGLLNTSNEAVIPFEFDRIHLMTNGHYYGFMSSSLLVVKGGKIGLRRMDGSVELSCSYDYIDISCSQTDCPKKGIQYYVRRDNKYGFINQDESIAISISYDNLESKGFGGLIRAAKNGKYGLIDTNENYVLKADYEGLQNEYFNGFKNLMAFKKSGKWGLIYGDYADMKIALPNKFDSVFTDYEFKEHFIIINDGLWGLADTSGKVVIKPQFEKIEAMEDGTFAYKKDGKWGFMNKTGFIHCSPRYQSIEDNIKNWCLVSNKGKYGFCKTSGHQIAAPIYNAPYWDDYLHSGEMLYTGRIAMAKSYGPEGNCVMGVLDSTGEIILPFEYECYDELVYSYGSPLIAQKKEKKY